MRFLLTVPILFLALASTAQANLIDEYAQIGSAYWQDQGITIPEVTFAVVDSPCGEADWQACAQGDRVEIGRTIVQQAETNHVDPMGRVWLCAIVLHELGHTGGLDDQDDGGIMDTYALKIPRDCRPKVARAVRKANRWLDRHLDRVSSRHVGTMITQKIVTARDCRSTGDRFRCDLSWGSERSHAACTATSDAVGCEGLSAGSYGDWLGQGTLTVRPGKRPVWRPFRSLRTSR